MSKKDYILEELVFDTKILERKTAKLTLCDTQKHSSQKVELVKTIINDFKERKLEYVTTRINATDFPTIHALESQGFRLVDGYIVLEANVAGGELSNNIREGTLSDLAKLREIAGSSFSRTRFYNDPQIKKHQADKLYSEWVKNCVLKKAADLVLVWDENGAIIGFTSIKKNGNIVLVAVSTNQQGKGVGKLLIKAALEKFFEWGIKSSSIETQMTNIPALRTYNSCGYKITDSYITFRWSAYED
jgi:dTDP-4-amino-4,6-dideoxy-D-galactose acyltransferase